MNGTRVIETTIKRLTRETTIETGIVTPGIERYGEGLSIHFNQGLDDEGSAMISDSYPGGGLLFATAERFAAVAKLGLLSY